MAAVLELVWRPQSTPLPSSLQQPWALGGSEHRGGSEEGWPWGGEQGRTLGASRHCMGQMLTASPSSRGLPGFFLFSVMKTQVECWPFRA